MIAICVVTVIFVLSRQSDLMDISAAATASLQVCLLAYKAQWCHLCALEVYASLCYLCVQDMSWGMYESQTAKACISQSDLMSYCAEQLIYSEIKEDLSVWVYESDMQTKEMVYRSNMTWPNKQHEDVYICIGMAGRESADTRCLSENMTVVFTDDFSTDHVSSTAGLQIKLPFKMFNHFLNEKEIEIRVKFCDETCQWTQPEVIIGVLCVGVPVLVVICGFLIAGCIECCNFIKKKRRNTCDPEAASGNSNHGESFSYPPLTIKLEQSIWIVRAKPSIEIR